MQLRHRVSSRVVTATGVACAVAAVGLGSTQAAVGRGVAAGAGGVSRYVVVSTTADRVNGNVSSIAALNRRPGRDGISLREALEATNHTRGSATLSILFSPRLNGKTISVRAELPAIHRSHLSLEGVAANGAPARVTLDARHAKKNALGELLLVRASNVTIRWLRFTGLDPRHNLNSQIAAVQLGMGRMPHTYAPVRIANVQIVDNVFDNSGFDFPYTGSSGGSSGLLANGLMLSGTDTHISKVTIARNTFRYFNNDACGVQADADGDTVSGVAILVNTFTANEIPIELGIAGNAPRLTGTQIIGNTMTPYTTPRPAGSHGSGINIDSNARNGTIDQTLIEDNMISGWGPLLIDASAPIPPAASYGNVISNTRIVNNVIDTSLSGSDGIALIGGNETTSPPSRISGVTIENDTIVDTQGTAGLFSAVPNEPPASGNQITDVVVRNSIFYEPQANSSMMGQPPTEQHPDIVLNSFISGPGWAGSNGNINGDPLFVNAAADDYHPAAGSPLINAGTTLGAPATDIDGHKRDNQPDIGAYEYVG
jgi:hypothetical protein